MTDLLNASHEIARSYIAVKYKNADAAPLRAQCADWLKAAVAEEWRIRDGRDRVPQQLDLLDKAKDRVQAVAKNIRAR